MRIYNRDKLLGRKQIVGGALLFASACGTTEPTNTGSGDTQTAQDTGAAADGTASDGGGSADTQAADTQATDSGNADTGASKDSQAADSGAADAGPADTGAMDSGAVDSGAVDSGAVDSGAADAGPGDAGAMDAVPTDAGPTDAGAPDVAPPDSGVADTAKADSGDTCDKPSAADAPNMIGQPCAQTFQAVCDDQNQVVIICQGGTWQTWTGGKCGCFHSQCGPDQANCIAIGFIGVARADLPRDVGVRLRKYA